MKAMLYKELRLALHPTNLLFLLLGAMLLIPAYPYYAAFIYTCLSVFFLFLSARENQDTRFTALLPVKKSDVVKGRCITVAAVELMQLLAGVPFAFLTARVNPNPAGNPVGIEANAAFFGLVLLLFGLFNVTFLPAFYRTAYKVGRALLFGGAAVTVYVVAAELTVQAVPAIKAALDTRDPTFLPARLAVLGAGALAFIVLTLVSYRVAARRFELVDL